LLTADGRFLMGEQRHARCPRRLPLEAAQQPVPDYAAVAGRLDQARAEIAPPLGATTYTLDHRRLLDQPGDENRSLAQSLTQLPGVTLGSNGQVHVRDQ
jgi:hypothetical protein